MKVLRLFGEFRRYKADQKKTEAELAELEQALGRLGFDTRGLYTNPLRGIGSALQIAEELGATIYRGTCYSDCRVSLPREKWKYSLGEDVNDSVINPWIQHKRTPEETEEISTWGRTVEIGVAKLLIACRRVGVI